MKKQTILTITGITCLATLMFMVGRVSNNTSTPEFTDESQTLNYTIESSYIPDEINFEEEARYIKRNFNWRVGLVASFSLDDSESGGERGPRRDL